MHLGIVGYPSTGKTTLFHLLAQTQEGTDLHSAKMEAQTALIELPDSRFGALATLLNPKKTTPARIALTDMKIVAGTHGLSPQTLNQIAPVDGILHVVRAFNDPNVAHFRTSVDPRRDVLDMESEFLINDLSIIERRIANLAEEKSKGARDKQEIEREQNFLHELSQQLSEELPLRNRNFTDEELRMVSSFGLLSQKPMLIVINHDDDQMVHELDDLDKGARWIAVLGKLELEINQLPPADAALFMQEYKIELPGRERILDAAKEILGIISFFTFNENELRAWQFKDGGTAVEAAATIHTDIGRGFIRAEIIPWNELIQAGGYNEARAAGILRIEGKNYPIVDGDVMYVRFNV
jgi:GTP-binding protein YchF